MLHGTSILVVAFVGSPQVMSFSYLFLFFVWDAVAPDHKVEERWHALRPPDFIHSNPFLATDLRKLSNSNDSLNISGTSSSWTGSNDPDSLQHRV